ncbi:hypothetical protein BD626DRAFT_522889 [Schizophyllum amplum]|uniref:Uncharacterized protein n=1 Tax=Schizophyllum amplum TaxID=97359 RepID=A0A550BT92_9AGAR|nr:hypothetical protein BD626DRAFT_522889 [Auriculariopsis ampla]
MARRPRKGRRDAVFIEYNAARTRRFVSQNLSYIIIFSALIADARALWAQIARQSRTLEDAAAEYRRRYGRNPPKGFDKCGHSQGQRLVMVDEFDGLVDDLEPSWRSQARSSRIEHCSGVILGEQLARRALQMIRPTWPPPPNPPPRSGASGTHGGEPASPQTPPPNLLRHTQHLLPPPLTTSIPARPQLSSI